MLEVKATGVCRSDWHGWKGHDSDIVDHGLPIIPGHEVSGVVQELGEGTTCVAVGDRVAVPFILPCGKCRECKRGRPTVCENQAQPGFTMNGAFAQYVALPRATNLCLLPQGVSFVAAAALGCRTTTAYRAVVQQGKVVAGQTVAVFGCGGLGCSAVMVAVAVGARVIAVDSQPAARAKAEAMGAYASVEAGATAVEKVIALADGIGADCALDCAGFAETSEAAVLSVRRAGRMVQVGLPLGGRTPEIPMARVANREIEIVGSHGMAAAEFPKVLALVAEGKLKVQELVEREVGLAEGALAVEHMDHGSPIGITVITSFDRAECEVCPS